MKRIIISASALLLLFCVLATFLLLSNRGLQLSVQLVSFLTENRINIESSTGRLIGPIYLEGIHFHSSQTNIFIKKLAVNWRPMGLLQNQVHIPKLIVEGVELTMEDQTLDKPDTTSETQLSQISVLIPFLFKEAVISDIAILSSVGEKATIIEEIRGSFSGGSEGISIDIMSVQFSDYRIVLEAHFQTPEGRTISGQGTWQLNRAGCSDMEGGLGVSGTLDNLKFSLSMIRPGTIDIQGSLSRISGELNWSVEGYGHDIFLPDICPDWFELKSNLTFHTEGQSDDFRTNLDAEISQPGLAPMFFELDMRGNNDGLEINVSPVHFDGSRNMLTGQVHWGEIVSWSALLSLSSLDFSPYQDVVAGRVDLELDIAGTIDENAWEYEAQISQLRLSVDEISEDITGTVMLRGDLQGTEIVEGRMAAGNQVVALSGQLGWTDGLEWEVLMQLAGIDPATWSDLPSGRLSAVVVSRGHMDGDDIVLNGSLTSLSGELAGHSVKGGGEVDYFPGQLEIKDLFLITGRNRMEVNGVAGDSLNLTLVVDGQDLSQIFEPLAGKLEIAASITGPKEKPVVNFSTGAVGIVYLDYALNKLHANGSVDKEGWIDLSLAVEHLGIEDSTIEELNLSILGTLENHTIVAGALSVHGDLKSSMTGQLLDYRKWEGSIDDLNYMHRDYGNWRQEKKSRATISPDLISFDDFCVTSSGQRICAGASWSSTGSWHAELSELQFDMSKLNDWNIIDLGLVGDVVGSVALDGIGPVVNNGKGTLATSKLHVILPENDLKDEIELVETLVTFSLHDQILEAAINSGSADGSAVDIALTVDQFGNVALPMPELPVKGSVRLGIVNVTLLKQLSGDLLLPSGRLNADFTITGTIQRPLLSGVASLEDGEIVIPDLGLLLSDLKLRAEGDQNGLSIDLRARSGDGQVSGTGVVFLDGHDWRVELSILGDNLQVIEQREMQVSISPDLDLRADSSGVMLTGIIEIPRARIEPEKMTSSDTTSRDTVFTDDMGSEDTIPFHFDIAVVLGDDVMATGYGFSGFFSGNLDISGANNGEIVGMGEIKIRDGLFSVRKRALDISRGLLLFAGGPVDDPVLDIQARKTIRRGAPGTTDVIVGVNIAGTAQDYNIELFSDPPMDARDILSYIALGRSFRSKGGSMEEILNSAAMLFGINRGNRLLKNFRGRGLVDRVSLNKNSGSSDVSLVVDRRLTNRLAIGYDFNLFENAGQFRFHYNLRKGFSLEVRDSFESTGVELLYSIER